MLAGYRELPYEQAPAYRALFLCLAAGEVPLIFNCSAGKDRAGTAAALVLSALGVPRDIVVQDYALSDKIVDYKRVFRGGSGDTHGLARLPERVADAILMSDPLYVEAALDSIDTRSGSLQSYLQDHLHLSPKDIAALRNTLLE